MNRPVLAKDLLECQRYINFLKRLLIPVLSTCRGELGIPGLKIALGTVCSA
jgi:hypothetical protein